METNKANFRKKAARISEQPSPDTWDKLEAKLDKAPAKKRNIRWYPLYAVAASFLLLVGFLTVNSLSSDKSAAHEALVHSPVAEASSSLGETPDQVAMIFKDAGTYQSFYEKVVEAKREGILKRYHQ